jgi:hypothetical protein
LKNTELLVAAVCLPVAFIVGVLIARVFPEGLAVDWGKISDWAVAIGTAATAIVAWRVYREWGAQLIAASEHEAAIKIAETAYELLDNFRYARRDRIDDWERPTGAVPNLSAVYGARMQIVRDRGQDLNALRYKARAILRSDPIAETITALVKETRNLSNAFQSRMQQVRRNHEADDDASNECARRVESLFKVLDDSLLEFFPDRQPKRRGPSQKTSPQENPMPKRTQFQEDHRLETYKSLITLSTEGFRLAALSNGGAAVALLAYLGTVAGKPGSVPDMRYAMACFLGGLCACGLSVSFAYLAQLRLFNEIEGRKVLHPELLWIAIAAFVGSFVCFGSGAWLAVLRFPVPPHG